MPIFYPIFIAILSLSPLLSGHIFASTSTYVYNKTLEGKEGVTTTTWTVIEKGNLLEIEGKGLRGTTKISSTPESATHTFNYQPKNKNSCHYTIEREGNHLAARRALFDQEPQQKDLRIGNNLWIQEFNFSLKPFILSKDQSLLKFYIVDPEKT